MEGETVSKEHVVSCDEARAILQRFNDSHWDVPGREKARYSIPANPDRDDDIRLARFIDQAEARERNEALDVPAWCRTLDKLKADNAKLRTACEAARDVMADMGLQEAYWVAWKQIIEALESKP